MLHSWGANTYGQLGLGFASEQENLPKRVYPSCDQEEQFVKIVGGGAHTLAITQDGRLFSCGWNEAGQLGLGHNQNVHNFTDTGVDGVVDIAGGWDFSCVVLKSGKVLVAGSNKFCQLGQEKTLQKSNVFLCVEEMQNILQVSAGLRHAAAIDKDGQLFTWGAGSKGQLARNCSDFQDSKPKLVHGLPNYIESVECGQYFTLIKTRTGEIFGFGDNKFKQIDSTDTKNFKIPTILPIRGVNSISCGWTHCLALCGKKELVVWGRNTYGQCGNSQLSTFQPCHKETCRIRTFGSHGDDLEIVKAVSGSEHCMVLGSTGDLYTWGWNEHGNLGNGHTDNVSSPNKIEFGGKICKDIFVGSAHCFAYIQ
eukprot:TRINITY_DN4797_c0_g1_i1.p1 TRINITY_DN4797_c0_g1~~TRINITY_DN4797_c0_g1_i1.p1  ORF type:complete len:366 (-),score=23.53 TRINITY_DN4797_c0_g1_i1:54-1151(-)